MARRSGWKLISPVKPTPPVVGAIAGGVIGLIAAGSEDGPIGLVLGAFGGGVAGHLLSKGKR